MLCFGVETAVKFRVPFSVSLGEGLPTFRKDRFAVFLKG